MPALFSTIVSYKRCRKVSSFILKSQYSLAGEDEEFPCLFHLRQPGAHIWLVLLVEMSEEQAAADLLFFQPEDAPQILAGRRGEKSGSSCGSAWKRRTDRRRQPVT